MKIEKSVNIRSIAWSYRQFILDLDIAYERWDILGDIGPNWGTFLDNNKVRHLILIYEKIPFNMEMHVL